MPAQQADVTEDCGTGLVPPNGWFSGQQLSTDGWVGGHGQLDGWHAVHRESTAARDSWLAATEVDLSSGLSA